MKLALLAGLSGCASILGLDNTQLGYKDAPSDSPAACDGLPATCTTSTTGRTLCGQLYGTDGLPLARVGAAGAPCTGSDGPCGFTVGAVPLAGFFAGTASPAAGTIDDCGRFAFPDLDASLTDVAVVFTAVALEHVSSARIVTGRMATAGVDTAIDGLAIDATTVTRWSTDLGTDVSSAYLVKYTTGGAPLAGVRAEHDGGAQFGAPPTVPFAAYFTTGFGSFDSAATMTGASGTALTGFNGNVSLEGLRTGHQRCKQAVSLVPKTIVYVVETNC